MAWSRKRESADPVVSGPWSSMAGALRCAALCGGLSRTAISKSALSVGLWVSVCSCSPPPHCCMLCPPDLHALAPGAEPKYQAWALLAPPHIHQRRHSAECTDTGGPHLQYSSHTSPLNSLRPRVPLLSEPLTGNGAVDAPPPPPHTHPTTGLHDVMQNPHPGHPSPRSVTGHHSLVSHPQRWKALADVGPVRAFAC